MGWRRRWVSIAVSMTVSVVVGLLPSAASSQSSEAAPISNASDTARQAFVTGYEAYVRRDYMTAVGPLQMAVSNLPELTDYALFYLAASQIGIGDTASAATTYRRLVEQYPESVFLNESNVEYAQLELKLGNMAAAEASARRVVLSGGNPTIDQDARLIAMRAAYAQREYADAYRDAQGLREKYPRGAYDSEAREAAYSILAVAPYLRGPSAFSYHRGEAALLLREGKSAAVLEQVRAALALAPSPTLRDDLYWIRAGAAQGDSKEALAHYLALEPHGVHAAPALDMLGHLYWRVKDTDRARLYFGRLVMRFPAHELASEAMFQIGRSYEDDHDYSSARADYLRLIRRYPHTESAAAARFRAPFMLYMTKAYDQAATEFERARLRADSPADRDMFSYWQARSLERAGDRASALRLYRAVGLSTASNYYPALASHKVEVEPTFTPAPAFSSGPIAIPHRDGVPGFHLTRVAALSSLSLRELEPSELRAIAHMDDIELRRYALREFQAAGDWYDAIQLATQMTARGELGPSAAEAIRYPRGYWELLNGAATRHQLNPWLVAALIRQESLFNPQARSSSDARGLMQLLPSTAERWAPTAGLSAASLDLFDPHTSVQIGTTYLRGLLDMFGDDPFRAVAAYNGGENAVANWNAQFPGDDDEWVENIGYRETRDYVKKVIGGMREYQLLYEPRSAVAGSRPATQSPG
jgi:soluble lytic murein transglycosylase